MGRNITLDYFKFVLSILVITIHFKLLYEPGLAYWLVSEGVARMAVPCFFIINGYYFAPKLGDWKAVRKYLLHLLVIYTTWFIIYLRPYYKLDHLSIFTNVGLDALLKEYFFGFFHLWYLPAAIVGIALLVLLKKTLKKDIILLVLAFILFAAGYFIEYVRDINYHYARNGLFIGFPFVMLGYYIRVKQLHEKIKKEHLYILCSLGLLCLIAESYIGYGTMFIRDLYVSLIVVCPSAFMLVLALSKYSTSDSKLQLYFSQLPSAIYFVHMYVLFRVWAGRGETVIPLLEFILIVFLSILASFVIIFINKRIKIFL